MAKFANVTYGTKGETAEYTYVVNDNVRTGDYIHPSVKHYQSGKVFGTTGIIQSTAKETSAKGKQLKQTLESNGVEPVKAYTGKEVGAERDRNASGKFAQGSGLPKTYRDEETGKKNIMHKWMSMCPNKYVRRMLTHCTAGKTCSEKASSG